MPTLFHFGYSASVAPTAHVLSPCLSRIELGSQAPLFFFGDGAWEVTKRTSRVSRDPEVKRVESGTSGLSIRDNVYIYGLTRIDIPKDYCTILITITIIALSASPNQIRPSSTQPSRYGHLTGTSD